MKYTKRIVESVIESIMDDLSRRPVASEAAERELKLIYEKLKNRNDFDKNLTDEGLYAPLQEFTRSHPELASDVAFALSKNIFDYVYSRAEHFGRIQEERPLTDEAMHYPQVGIQAGLDLSPSPQVPGRRRLVAERPLEDRRSQLLSRQAITTCG